MISSHRPSIISVALKTCIAVPVCFWNGSRNAAGSWLKPAGSWKCLGAPSNFVKAVLPSCQKIRYPIYIYIYIYICVYRFIYIYIYR